MVAVNNKSVPLEAYVDTILIPGLDALGTPQEVSVIIPFTDPIIEGKFLYHCHVMRHEDHGMMAVVEVYRNSSSSATTVAHFNVVSFLFSLLYLLSMFLYY